jgi:hypothetical protein
MVDTGDAKAVWLERVLGLRVPPASDRATSGKAMVGWTSARATALASLKALEGAYRGMKHPLSDRAIILVRAIQANLTAEPGTPAQVKELESYLVGDRIIAEAESPNGFGFEVKLRVPLMAALAALKQEQAAGSVKP